MASLSLGTECQSCGGGVEVLGGVPWATGWGCAGEGGGLRSRAIGNVLEEGGGWWGEKR